MSDSNMKQAIDDVEDDLRPEYDLASLLNGAVRGKYVEQYVTQPAAADHYAVLMARLTHVQAGRAFSREDMNERR